MGYISRKQSGTIGYFERDGHGDILSVYGSNGTTKLASYTYDAFGNQLANSGTWANTNPIRYCGEYYDTQTGLIYLRARYYDSESGRFMNADSYWNIGNMIYDGENISATNILQSNNLYNYCLGNPVMYVDRTGNVVTEADYEAYDNDLLDSAQIQVIADASYEYERCMAINDYAGMNAAHERAMEIRKIYYAGYEDNYDKTHGGKCYSDGTLVVEPESKRELSVPGAIAAAIVFVVPATYDAYFSGDFQNTEDYAVRTTNTLEEYALDVTSPTSTPYLYDDLSDIAYDNKKQNGQMGR